LGYFYSLEKKYDKSEANYLTALKLATDDGRKAIIEQELKKIRDVMQQPKLGGETKP
jgi:predicted nucleic acid-binding Zn finger protein